MRLYSNVALDTVLTADLLAGVTVINAGYLANWPAPSTGDTALACIDFGLSTVEVIEYAAVSGATLTGCVRGQDLTTNQFHAAGAKIRHIASAADVQAFVRFADVYGTSLLAATWYPPPGVPTLSTGGMASGTLRSIQTLIPGRTRILGLGIEVTTIGAGNIRFAIYRDNGSGKPGTLVADCGVVSGNTLGFRSVTIDVTLPRGLYYLAAMAEGATISVRTTSVHIPPVRVPVSSTTSTSPSTGWIASGVATGSAPTPFPSGMVTANGLPFILMLTA